MYTHKHAYLCMVIVAVFVKDSLAQFTDPIADVGFFSACDDTGHHTTDPKDRPPDRNQGPVSTHAYCIHIYIYTCIHIYIEREREMYMYTVEHSPLFEEAFCHRHHCYYHLHPLYWD